MSFSETADAAPERRWLVFIAGGDFPVEDNVGCSIDAADVVDIGLSALTAMEVISKRSRSKALGHFKAADGCGG